MWDEVETPPIAAANSDTTVTVNTVNAAIASEPANFTNNDATTLLVIMLILIANITIAFTMNITITVLLILKLLLLHEIKELNDENYT